MSECSFCPAVLAGILDVTGGTGKNQKARFLVDILWLLLLSGQLQV